MQSWILLELQSLEVRLFRWLVCLLIGGQPSKVQKTVETTVWNKKKHKITIYRRMIACFIPLFQSCKRTFRDCNSSRIQDYTDQATLTIFFGPRIPTGFSTISEEKIKNKKKFHKWFFCRFCPSFDKNTTDFVKKIVHFWACQRKK